MSFLWPYGLVALAGVPAAVLIGLWRARRRDLTVPSLMLWERLAEKMAETGRKRRRFVDASLVFAAIFAVLAGVSVAGPAIVSLAPQGRTVLLVVDRSASMQMKQGGVSRWELALRELRTLLAELKANDCVCLAASPPGEPVRVGPVHPQQAAARLGAMRPTDRPGDIARDTVRALAAAQALEPFVPVVCTDTPEMIPGGIAAIGVGGVTENVFFTRFSSSNTTVLLGVKNIGQAKVVAVNVTADDELLGEKTVGIEKDDEASVIFEGLELAESQWVEARIDVDDALAADNFLYAAREPEKRVRVLFTGRDNLYVEKAVGVHPAVQLTRGSEPKDASALRLYDLLIYNGVAPANLSDRLTVVIDPPTSFGPVTVGGKVHGVEVTSIADDPLTKDTGLLEITVETARRITSKATVLAGSERGPLVIRDEGLVCLAFDLSPENTRWMLTSGFPVFWAKLMEVPPAQQPRLACARLGDEIRLRATHPASTLKRIRPGHRLIERREAGEFPFRPDAAGIYELAGGEDRRLVAFAMLDSGESSTRGSTKHLDRAMLAGEARGHAGRELPVTALLLCAALASAMAHWCMRR